MAPSTTLKRRKTSSSPVSEPEEEPPKLNELIQVLSVGAEAASDFWNAWCFRDVPEKEEESEREWTTDYYKKDISFSDTMHVRLQCHHVRGLDVSTDVPDRSFTNLVLHKRHILLFVPLNTKDTKSSFRLVGTWKAWLDQHTPMVPTSLVWTVEDDHDDESAVFWMRLGVAAEKMTQDLNLVRFYLWRLDGKLDGHDAILRNVVDGVRTTARDDPPRPIAVSPSSTISTRSSPGKA